MEDGLFNVTLVSGDKRQILSKHIHHNPTSGWDIVIEVSKDPEITELAKELHEFYSLFSQYHQHVERIAENHKL